MMNALYISYDGATDPLGQSQIIPYIKGLSKKNINFTLLTFDKKYYEDTDQIRGFCEDLRKNNIKWIKLRYHKKPAVISTVFDIFYGLCVSGLAVKRDKITIVHARSYVSAAIAMVLKKIFKTKIIFDMRGFWADERVEGRIWKRKGVLYRMVKLLEKEMLKSADEIIVLAEAAKTIIGLWGYSVNNVSVIPCCTDTDYFKSDAASHSLLRQEHNLTGKFIFVHTGSLEYWYMKEAMFDYFRTAKELIPGAHFLIISHSHKGKILELIRDKGMDAHDFTMLSIPFADMPKYLTIADVGLIFITPVFSKEASCPTKFAEYLSSSIPVIINNKIGDLESYVIKNNIGVVVRDFNENEYKRGCSELLVLMDDKNLKSRCREVACRNFSLNMGVNRYYEVYARLK